MRSVKGAGERAASQCILRISCANAPRDQSEGFRSSAEGAESLESFVESLGSQILFAALNWRPGAGEVA